MDGRSVGLPTWELRRSYSPQSALHEPLMEDLAFTASYRGFRLNLRSMRFTFILLPVDTSTIHVQLFLCVRSPLN